jgi:hypothetical protein
MLFSINENNQQKFNSDSTFCVMKYKFLSGGMILITNFLSFFVCSVFNMGKLILLRNWGTVCMYRRQET